jgi:hypothetical protein
MNTVIHKVEDGDTVMFVTYDAYNNRYDVTVKRYGYGEDYVYLYKSYKRVSAALAAGMKWMPKN